MPADILAMEHRQDPRYSTDLEVPVTLMRGREYQLLGHARNVSRRGMCLELNMPVATGARLRVEMEGGPVFGEVIYCRKHGEGYFVGLRLESSITNIESFANGPLDAA
jgi:hypothetical protein